MAVTWFLALSLNFLSINSQVVFVSQPKTWEDAQADCEAMGTDLLTAQGNPLVS